MYLEHFQLKELPFRLSPDPAFLYASPVHSRAKAYMESTIWFTDGFVIITGEIGSGKTTLIESFLKELDKDVVVAQLNQTQVSPIEFLQSALAQFGFNPFKMKKAELIATLMIEIDEPNRRTATLMKLAGIEESAYLQVGAEKIEGKPTEYEDRTSEDGKTSSVHWVRFPFTKAQIAAFRNAVGTVILGVSHPQYGHMAVVPAEVREELAKDFD
jgi:energy-coupling factor transporter ATP-binding protein EcfA2